MALFIDEIMNRELFSLRPGESVAKVLRYFRALEISCSPVIDGGRVVGMVSIGDVLGARPGDAVELHMSTPPISLPPKTPIESAAKLMAETNVHHLVVVDEEESAIGFVSSLDVVRALVGLPTRHPQIFPHYDRRTGLTWSDDTELTMNRVESAPEGAGVIALIHGGAGMPERIVWAETAHRVRARLIDLLTGRDKVEPPISYWLSRGSLRFRVAVIEDDRAAAHAIDVLQRGAGYERV